MKLEPLDRSSHIIASAYDPHTRTLTIQFKSDAIYTYSNVDELVHKGLREAKSRGAYFNEHIRKLHGVKVTT